MIDLKQVFDSLQEPSFEPIQTRLQRLLVLKLTDGSFKPGDTFPSEAVLHEKLKLDLDVIHSVMQGLIDNKLIEITTQGELYVLSQSTPTVPGRQVVGLIANLANFHVYYGQMVAAFNHGLQKAGWETELAIHDEQIDKLREIIEQMMQRNVRAFSINPPWGVDMASILKNLRAQGVLVQLVGRQSNYSDCDYIGADHEQIGYQATRHLIELGHTHIIYAGGAYHATSHERVRGYVKAMSESGLQARIFNVHTYRPQPISPEFQPYLDPENTPTALWREMVRHRITAAFCFNHEEAIWIYNEIRKFNLLVPRDISLITVDKPPVTGFMGASLTTFALPGEEMGRQAATLLLRRLAGEDFAPQKILLPGDLILKSSTSAPREWRASRG
jgi:DNA-binding LacI/PurR family transcriptional regulator